MAIIESTRKNIEAQELRWAVEQKRKDYNSKTLADQNAVAIYLQQIKEIRQSIRNKNAWRLAKLDELNDKIRTTESINNLAFLKYLKLLQDPSITMEEVPDVGMIFRTAFNLYRTIRKGLHIQ